MTWLGMKPSRVFVEIEMIIEFTGSEGTDYDGLSATVGRSRSKVRETA